MHTLNEFQKRGLPHPPFFNNEKPEFKYHVPNSCDSIVSTKILDKDKLLLFEWQQSI